MRTSTADVYWKIFGTCKKETEKAFLWKLTRTGQEIWIPKSQCRNYDTFPDEDGDHSLLVKEWILNDKSISENDRYPPNDPAESPRPVYNTAADFFDDLDDEPPF